MNSIQFTCNMCGERHNKLLPLSTDLTACHRCGNLVDISSQQVRNRRKSQRNQNLFNENFKEDDEYNLGDEILGPEYDDDFYNFDRYESHEDYLPNPNQRNPRFNRNGNNNRPFVRVGNNNRNRSNSTGGMFSIQIANDNYDRTSAFHRRSNFGFPRVNNRNSNRNNINLYRDLDNISEDFDLEDELDADLELMSIMGSNNLNSNINNGIGLLANLLKEPEKPKIKLKKIKMCKDLYTKNDQGKLEKPTCCICLVPMKIGDDIVLLKCQHLFHYNCLEKWIETKEVCPFCRGKIEFGTIKKKEDKKVEDKKISENKNKTNETKPIINKKENKKINDNSIFNTKKKKSKK